MRDYDLSLLQNLAKMKIESFAFMSGVNATSVTLSGIDDGRYFVASLMLESRPEYCKVSYKESEAHNRGVEQGLHQFKMADVNYVLTSIAYFGDAAGDWCNEIYRLKSKYGEKHIDDANH